MTGCTDGYVNADGLANLEKCPDVLRVHLEMCFKPID